MDAIRKESRRGSKSGQNAYKHIKREAQTEGEPGAVGYEQDENQTFVRYS